MSFTKPPIITIPFADAGDKTLPASGTPTSVVSESLGFPASMSIPAGQPGSVDVPRDQTNGAFNLYSDILRWINTGGTFTFEADVAAAGGYNAGAVLWNAATNSFVYSIKNNNTDDFVTTPGFIDDVSWGFTGSTEPSGTIRQIYRETNNNYISSAGLIDTPNNDSIPQITQGGQAFSKSFTPLKPDSVIVVQSLLCVGSVGAGRITAIFRNGESNAVSTAITNINQGQSSTLARYQETVSTLDPITYMVRFQSDNAPSLNGYSGLRTLGGSLTSWMEITEYAP